VRRFDDGGWEALVERSSRPHCSPRRTSAQTEARVLAERQSSRRGQDWIAAELGIPARTISRILRRHRVPRLCECDPLTGQVIRASRSTARRYEREHPGDLVHIDVKKVGKIPDGGGWRAHGRGTRPTNKRGLGFDYVHSCVDDHSRLAYSEILPDEKGPTCAGFLIRATDYFTRTGVTIREVITDNHLSYRKSTDFAAAVAALGARQRFIRPHCPWQNGKVERFNRTLQIEWAYRQIFTSNTDRAAALAPWLDYYNTRRRHTALGGLPPASRLSPT
jgi:transposase InsO family protein